MDAVTQQVSQTMANVKGTIQGQVNQERMPLQLPQWTGKPPRPSSVLSAATPQDLRHGVQATRAEQSAKLSEELNSNARVVTGSGVEAKTRAQALWGVARTAMQKTAHSITATTTEGLSAASDRVGQRIFASQFADLAEQDVGVKVSFECQVTHANLPISGTLFVTPSHLCFTNSINGSLADTIPWRDVVSIVLCVQLATYGGPPFLSAVPDPRVKPEALQIFLTEGRVLEVYSIHNPALQAAADTTAAEMRNNIPAVLCQSAIDQAWRAVATVPVPGVEYSDV